MGVFGSIKNAIFGRRKQQQPQGGQAMPQVGQAQQPQAQQPVDVEQVLGDIHREKGSPNLNYKTSIVDLMKLLDLDSSLGARKELAQELGYQGALDGSAEMNVWLHKAVMRELEKNGGKVPASMKD
jgi:hypothetical protein